MKKRLRPRFRAACIAGVVTGVLLAVVGIAPTIANADPPEDNAAQNCESALNGDSDPQLVLSTDPAGGTTVSPGDEIEATLTWGTAPGDDVWASIDKVLLCMTVDDVLDEGSIFEEKPGVDDGTASTTFTVPEGAGEVCVHGRVSGNPGPDNDTDSTHKTGQTCFPVGEPACAEGQTGTYPDCEDPACAEGQTGTYPDCEDPACAEGQTGTYPDCEDPACAEGQTGTYPDCEDPACAEGQTGTYPDCEDPACAEGQTGTYPDCEDPACAEGQTGTYPDCEDPACAEGQTGTYPDCEDPACAEGQTGTYPDCEDPTDACPDMDGDQPEGTDCDPPVDGCPDVEGMQEPGADCEAQVLPNVVTRDAPSTPAPTEVEAETLPRTGADTLPTVGLALALISLGGVLVTRSRKAS